MSVTTFEAVVENGQIKLSENVRLPEKTKVYVVVPQFVIPSQAFIVSPRLAHPEQIIDFEKEVVEEENNAGL